MKVTVPFKLAGLAALIFLADSSAWAVITSGAQLPGSVQPGQVSETLSQPRNVKPEVAPSISQPPEQAQSQLGEQAKKIKFKLNGIILTGNHIYSTEQLALIYKDKLGKTISVADLLDIAVNITNFYRNTGYIISRAVLPPQHVKEGTATIQIIEGYIGNVDVGGTPRGAKCIVQAYGNQIKKCRPLKINRMEKYLFIANELSGTQVKAVLAPSKTSPGAADLTLVTENRPVTGYVSYDTYGTRYIGPQQMTANVGFNSFISSGDAGQVTMTRTPKGGELNFLDVNYNMPIDDEGTTWLFGATRAHTHPLFVITSSEIDGTNSNYYSSLQYPIIRERDQRLSLTSGFYWVDSEVTTLGQPLYNDHIRSLDLGLNYNFADKWYGVNQIVANFRQGLPILGYTSNTDPDSTSTLSSRPGGRGDYTKIALQMTRLQAVKGPVSLFGVLKGQWAFNPLLSSEQFTFGGSQLGRGYDAAEIIGDKGAAASLELRYDLGVGKFYLQSLQLYAFYDAGMMWDFKEIAGTPKKQSGITTGFGTRFNFTRYVSGNLMWTQNITKEVAAEELIGQGYRPRVFFSVVAAFG